MKYMGSKSKIAKYIVPIIQKQIDDGGYERYYEPFVGGANVIDKIDCRERYGSDLNRYLIALLTHVRDGGALYKNVTREMYNEAREAAKNAEMSDFEDWELGNIGFLASFGGRWFDGGYAPAGVENQNGRIRVRDYYREASDNLIKQAAKLNGIQFCCADYREIQPHNAVVYCDPPYFGTKEYQNAKAFDYEEFWDVVRLWSKDNVVLVSEETAPDDFEVIWEKQVMRTIKACDKRKETEKLFRWSGCLRNEEAEA